MDQDETWHAGRFRPRPHCVRRGPSSPPPIFGPYLLRPNGCMDQDVTWYAGRPRPRRLCVRWEPRSPPQKGAEPPNFRPMFIVSCRTRVKRLYACAQIHYLCFSNYRIRVEYSAESRDVTDVICAKDRLQYVHSYRYRNIFLKHCSLSQKRLKPSLGNSNVHR